MSEYWNGRCLNKVMCAAGERDAAEECNRLADRIEELETGLTLLLSWAENWDSPFTEDDEWRETDGPKIKALLSP